MYIYVGTFVAFVRMNIPSLQSNNTSQGVNDTVMSRKDVTITPRTIRELIIGNPLKAGWELRKTTSMNNVFN